METHKIILLVQTGKPGPREEERPAQDGANGDHLPRPPIGSSQSPCRLLSLYQLPQQGKEGRTSGFLEGGSPEKGPAGTDSVPRRLPLTEKGVTVPCPTPTPIPSPSPVPPAGPALA